MSQKGLPLLCIYFHRTWKRTATSHRLPECSAHFRIVSKASWLDEISRAVAFHQLISIHCFTFALKCEWLCVVVAPFPFQWLFVIIWPISIAFSWRCFQLRIEIDMCVFLFSVYSFIQRSQCYQADNAIKTMKSTSFMSKRLKSAQKTNELFLVSQNDGIVRGMRLGIISFSIGLSLAR